LCCGKFTLQPQQEKLGIIVAGALTYSTVTVFDLFFSLELSVWQGSIFIVVLYVC